MPKLASKCIRSWKKYLPEYKLKLWDENNFNININMYVKQAYLRKKYAFVSDYVRLYALYNYGGVYMDVDVEVLKSLDGFLHHSAFSGFENGLNIHTGIIGAIKENDWIKVLLNDYNDRHFIDNQGNMDITTNVSTITRLSKQYGLVGNNKLQILKVGEVAIYPDYYFCPYNAITGVNKLGLDSFTIHHFAGTWEPAHRRFRNKIIRVFGRIFGLKTVNFFRKLLKRDN